MQFLTTITLKLALGVLETFRLVDLCASAVGLIRSDLTGKSETVSLKVFRPSFGIDNELVAIGSVEEAIPIRAGEDLLYAFEDQIIGDGSERVFVTLRCVDENLIGQVDLESFIFPSGDAESPDFELEKQQYRFARLLHERLQASETIGYPDENEENPWYHFSDGGDERRIDILE